jgi:acyl-CoA reductase-like NAD-dependent aldehyde dehydrogenase
VQRIYADKKIASVLADRLAASAVKLKVGDPTLPETEVGPMIRESEVRRVDEWVQEAGERGAEIRCGAKAVGTRCYAPTVLVDPPDDCQVSTHEVFGPVICVYSYQNLDEAIARSNALPYAFQAAVFTRDLDTALRATRRLDAAAVMVNDHTAFRVDWMPFAGLRESGHGVGGIPCTMDEMQIKKLVVIKSKEL